MFRLAESLFCARGWLTYGPGVRASGMRSIAVVAPAKVNLFLSVAKLRPDGFHDLVTVFLPRSEMGQGLNTSIPMLVAEELDISLDTVRVTFAEPGKTDGLSQLTGGSTTTAGTGAEVTKNAVIASLEHQVKVSLRSPFFLPRIALVDPELTYSLPAQVTIATGLDALTQLIEPLVSSRANPATDGLCREGISRVARSLLAVIQNGKDATAREEMALASLFGGLALANAGLGAVHGFAGPIGGMFNAPHGLICGILLPFVVDANIHALRLRTPDSMALGRYDEIGRLLTGSPDAVATDGLAWLTDVSTTLKVPKLSALDIPKAAIPEIASKAAKASSMKANPIELTSPELEAILEAAW